VLRLDLEHPGDQRYGPFRGTLAAVAQHVDVGVGEAFPVDVARELREAAVGEPPLGHHRLKRLAERLLTVLAHASSLAPSPLEPSQFGW
jgi:hypothetical protein